MTCITSLLLSVVLLINSTYATTGLPLWIGGQKPCGPNFYAISRTIVVNMQPDGLYVNADPLDEAKLAPAIREIMKTRAEKVMFFYAHPNADFQTAAGIISRLQNAVPDMKIALTIHDRLQRGMCGFSIPPAALDSVIYQPRVFLPEVRYQ